MNNSGNSQPDSPEDLKQMVMEILGLEEDLVGQVVLMNYEDMQSNWKFTLDELLAKLDQYYTNKVLEVVNHGTPDYSKLDVRNEAMLEGYNLAVTELRQAIKQLSKRGE